MHSFCWANLLICRLDHRACSSAKSGAQPPVSAQGRTLSHCMSVQRIIPPLRLCANCSTDVTCGLDPADLPAGGQPQVQRPATITVAGQQGCQHQCFSQCCVDCDALAASAVVGNASLSDNMPGSREYILHVARRHVPFAKSGAVCCVACAAE